MPPPSPTLGGWWRFPLRHGGPGRFNRRLAKIERLTLNALSAVPERAARERLFRFGGGRLARVLGQRVLNVALLRGSGRGTAVDGRLPYARSAQMLFLPSQEVKQVSCMAFVGRLPQPSMHA